MSVSSALHRRDTHPTWAWFAIGLFVLVAVLVLFVLPRRSSGDEVGARGPTVRPQSDTRPMPPPVGGAHARPGRVAETDRRSGGQRAVSAGSEPVTLRVGDREVVITNPDKVLFPEARHTKLDLAQLLPRRRRRRAARHRRPPDGARAISERRRR